MNNQTDYSRYTPPQQQSSSRTWLYVIIGLVAVCLCCAIIAVAVVLLGGVGFAGLFTGLMSEAGAVSGPVDGFMTAMAAQDAEAALTYFTRRSTVSLEDLQEQLSGRNFARYDGYESLSTNSFSTDSTNGVATAEIGGTVRYRNGDTAEFSADLRKEDGVWKLVRLPAIDFR